MADVGRARAVLDAARGTRAGRGLDDAPAICFGGHDRGSVLPDGVAVISSSLDHENAAARLIHLRTHVADGLHRFPAPGVPCDRQMEVVMAAEARAIAAEITACDELGCAEPPYTFASKLLAAAPDERVGLVLARMRDEPAADGLDGMLRRYRVRCEQMR
ncbi:hypothetical protein OV079_28065 [Nannocystis pusilla]|uniref:Uncharacterized protein n=1 Tax=Nannocystis pusilla TaxID=889268 RepID=A0A9X3ESI2_9BACT|nr:hypothetical protein [Nannocystis pusilla]MCY1009352.1 hypothetical protein [Nannocystis pusilla]